MHAFNKRQAFLRRTKTWSARTIGRVFRVSHNTTAGQDEHPNIAPARAAEAASDLESEAKHFSDPPSDYPSDALFENESPSSECAENLALDLPFSKLSLSLSASEDLTYIRAKPFQPIQVMEDLELSLKSPDLAPVRGTNRYKVHLDLQGAISFKRKELARLEREIKELELQQRSQEVQNTVLEDQLEQLKMILKRVKAEISSLQSIEQGTLDDVRLAYEMKTKEINADFDKQIMKTKEELTEEIESSVSELRQKNLQEKELMQAQLALLRQELDAKTEEMNRTISTLKANHQQATSTLRSEAQEKTATFLKQASELQALIHEKRRANGSLMDELKKAQTVSAAHVDKTMEALKKKRQKKEDEVKVLQKQIGDIEAQIDEINLFADRSSKTTEEYELYTKEQQRKFHALEAERRLLHNKLQELKGNIRVFCRIKPCHDTEAETTEMYISDELNEVGKQVLTLETNNSIPSLGTTGYKGGRNSSHNFQFDNIFSQDADNTNIFLEISQLVQSSLDGYNVCVFAYGQTGSGKTYTMSHQNDGMIPLSIGKIFSDIADLREKGWEYSVEGHFVEIYNELIIDLLAVGKKDAKLEIKHDDLARKTTVTNCTTVVLNSKEHALEVLERASRKRATASTLMNIRSSRSHSAFILNIKGFHEKSNTTCDGTLNLIDLAGSERLNSSQVKGDRLKETQAINKSLSCLGDVIHSLGQRRNSPNKEPAHVPYRNSKLTFLLKHSLGGESKTLMFVNVSPEAQNASETINSLRFATKVNGTRLR